MPESENVKQTTDRIESLGLPLVVLKAPNCYAELNFETMYQEIETLGKIFNNEEKAKKIVNYFAHQVQSIKDRTGNIKEQDEPTAFLLGLSPMAKEKGGAGTVLGLENPESTYLESIAKAKNAFRRMQFF